MDANLYEQILKFYTSCDKKYPQYIYTLHAANRVNAKSKFRQTAKPFHAESGVLYHGAKEVLVKSRVASILESCHDNATIGGHFGRDKTYGKISQRFYWKGMKKDVQEYIKACTKCFITNYKVIKEAPPLNSIHVPAKIWSLVGIDIIGPLHETKSGNKYIVAITDHFSKRSEAAAISDKSAKSVAQFLYTVVCRLCCMDSLISDQGREFVNKVIDILTDCFQTDHRITSAYHPQSNGQRERDNRTLKSALSKLTSDEVDDWDQYIPGILFAYHTSIHASTKCMPFEVMYGRTPKLPIDMKSAEKSDAAPLPDSVNHDVLQTLHNIRKYICSTVQSNIVIAQSRQKKSYDRRHNSNKEITKGSTVYIKNSRRIHRMGSKLEPLWIGPYIVIKSLDKCRVKLKNAKTNCILRNTYHSSNLKIYKYATSSSDVPQDHEHPASDVIPGRPCDTVEVKPQKSKRPRVELGETRDTKDNANKKLKSTRMFSPLSTSARNNLAIAWGLISSKTVYYGRPCELAQPRRTYKTKGDGNCYFRSISYILTGSEDNHGVIRDRVVQHMNTDIPRKLKDYLNQNVDEYVTSSGNSRDGVWATDAEVMATASLLGCDIAVHTMVGQSMQWLTYPASFSLQILTGHALYLENVSVHFNVVISV